MTVFVPESIKVLGSDAGGASVVLCDMFVDDLSDLPALDAYTGYKLSMGCTATVINDNSRHRVNSVGQWVQIAAGASTYTRSEIDAMISAINAEIETITPAAVKAVDEGAKNIADFTSTTKTTYTTATFHGVTITRNGDIFTISGTSDTNDNAFFNIYYEGSITSKIIPPGNWVALIEDYTGSVVKDIAIQIATPTVPPAKPYSTPIKFSLSGSESGNWLRVNIRPSTTYNGSFRLMICSQKDYAVSPKFVPYAPTNRQLYEMILQLQGG